MAERSRVFDNAPSDYSAEDHVQMWRGVLKVYTGVVATTDTRNSANNHLEVVAGSGLQVIVSQGRAFVDGYWYENDTPKPLFVSTPDPSNTRIDLVALKLEITPSNVRDGIAIQAVIIAGDAVPEPSVPSPVESPTVKYLPLATIEVGAGASNILQGSITDARVYVVAHAPEPEELDVATFSEIDTGTEDGKAISPAGLKASQYRKITISDRAPSNDEGEDGDVWFEY